MVIEAPKRNVPEAGHEAIRDNLARYGLETLSLQQERQVFDDFTQHVRMGFNLQPGNSSLLTAPSHLYPVSSSAFTKIPQGKEVFVVEIGGTNIRAARVVRKDMADGEFIHIEDSRIQQMKKKHYGNSGEFFEEVAQVARPILGEQKPDIVGFIWSYPATTEVVPHGVDAISTSTLTKELTIGGIESSPVGKQLLDSLGLDSSSIDISVLNDTVAVLLAGFGKVGGVIASGFNLASTNKQLYNLEAGGFSKVPQTRLTREVDDSSEKPGHYLAEKQISGLYVGKTFNVVVRKLIEKHVLQSNLTKELSAEDITAVLSSNTEKITHIFPGISENDFTVVREVAEVLIERSAQLAGSLIAALLMQLDDPEITVPIEGTFFNKTPGYKKIVEEVVGRHVKNKKVTLVGIEQGGIKGAAIAALTVNATSMRRDSFS